MNKKNIVLTVVAVLLAVALAAGCAAWMHYRDTHVKVDGQIYRLDLQELNLRGTNASPEHYQNLHNALPDCRILWDVPFQGDRLPDDIQSLTVKTLSLEDVEGLQWFPELTEVDARGCRDYEAIAYLEQQYPACHVDYEVELGGELFDRDAAEAEFAPDQVTAEELHELLPYLKNMSAVHFDQPTLSAEALTGLREAFPAVTFTWVKDVLGEPVRDDVTELDFTGRDVGTLESLDRQLKYFPSLEKVILTGCGFENEELAAFRDQVRDRYKPVWELRIGPLTVRTDDTYFMPSKYHTNVVDSQLWDLQYCEDMICVDLGHMLLLDPFWLENMPHIKYLILADTPVRDISVLSNLKEMVYVELFSTNIIDPSPLLECTALQDLNLSKTKVDPTALAQMTWLDNLWVNQCEFTNAERQMLMDSLPDTRIEFDLGWPTGSGWRELQNYYDMRDLLEMSYNIW